MSENNEQKVYELIIVGGGPAGAAGGVYAGRKKLNTLVIKSAWGGQSVVSTDIHNWIGTKSISGEKLAKDLQEHVEQYKSEIFEIVTDEVIKISKKENNLFECITKNNKSYYSKTVLVTTGSNRRTLGIPGAKEFEHKGLTYCASCDGLFFEKMDVAVVGGGNAAFESALQLSAYCKSVSILVRGEKIRADELTQDAVKKYTNIKVMINSVPTKIIGEKMVTGIEINNSQALSVSGVFVEIGQIPNTECVKGLVEIDEIGKIKIDPWTGATNVAGIWAAGDCTNIKYHQNNIAAGMGVTALEDIYQFIKQS